MTLSIYAKNHKARTLYKVKKVPTLSEFGWRTESQLRQLIYQSQAHCDQEDRVVPGNSMAEMGAIKRIGKSIRINVNKLRTWINGRTSEKITLYVQ